MIKENVKANITGYEFLRLLVSTMMIQERTPIFENQQLQKELYAYYNHPDFQFLFEDICKKESIENNNYVDLGNAFQVAYALGLLSMLQDSCNLKSVINLSKEESKQNILQFSKRQREAMDELVTELYLLKEKKKARVLVKK